MSFPPSARRPAARGAGVANRRPAPVDSRPSGIRSRSPEALAKRRHEVTRVGGRHAAQKPDHRHRRLLRTSGHADVAAPPSSAMNARRLMLTTQLPPYGHVTAPAAKVGRQLQLHHHQCGDGRIDRRLQRHHQQRLGTEYAFAPTTRTGGGRMRPRVIAVPIALVAIIGAASAARLPETD
jgi:hypothetical protein